MNEKTRHVAVRVGVAPAAREAPQLAQTAWTSSACRPFWPDLEGHLLAFLQGLEAAALDGTEVHEQVGAASRVMKPEALWRR